MNKRGDWSARRGQANADLDITQVLDRPHPGEMVQEIPDSRIEDSRYQARSTVDEDQISELVQAMEEVGFQGVLIARPHDDAMKRDQEIVELVYGHRRRAAWRRVCDKRNVACVLPVVVRPLSNAQLLTIGAQENLQREDLDPVEEAQIVAWHQSVYADKTQSDIGQMLGKSLSWVKSRSRIAQLPDVLKVYLRQRPRAVDQLLDIGKWYEDEPDAATQLAERVVREGLTADTVREVVRGYVRPGARETSEKKFGTELFVKDGTIIQPSEEEEVEHRPTQARASDAPGGGAPGSGTSDAVAVRRESSSVHRDVVIILTIFGRWHTGVGESSYAYQEIYDAVARIKHELESFSAQSAEQGVPIVPEP